MKKVLFTVLIAFAALACTAQCIVKNGNTLLVRHAGSGTNIKLYVQNKSIEDQEVRVYQAVGGPVPFQWKVWKGTIPAGVEKLTINVEHATGPLELYSKRSDCKQTWPEYHKIEGQTSGIAGTKWLITKIWKHNTYTLVCGFESNGKISGEQSNERISGTWKLDGTQINFERESVSGENGEYVSKTTFEGNISNNKMSGTWSDWANWSTADQEEYTGTWSATKKE